MDWIQEKVGQPEYAALKSDEFSCPVKMGVKNTAMYQYSQIKTLHLEITSKCNASCPMCLRNISGGKTNPRLPLTELGLSDIKVMLPSSFIKQLSRLYMCGNYGDPMAARDTIKIFRRLRNQNPALHLSLFTNGSGRSASWWKELAKTVNVTHFSIDGLEDTNHIYRRGTNFQKIMASVTAYLKAGGNAVWDYIVFRHNEHQVEEAGRLAKKMGFQKFVVKKTGRFFSNQRAQVKFRQPVMNSKGEVEYFLEMPENPDYRNPSLMMSKNLYPSGLKTDEKSRIKVLHQSGSHFPDSTEGEKPENSNQMRIRSGLKIDGFTEREKPQNSGTIGITVSDKSLYEHFNQTPIVCKVAAEKSIYISAEGYVFPCCWLANQLYPWYLKEREGQIWRFIDSLPEKEQSLSLKMRSLKDIVEDTFFQSSVPESWRGKDIKKDRLQVCAKTCGKTFDPFRDQFSSSPADFV